MEQVIQSPFLQALGYAIINSLWQFALLWLIYVCINTPNKLSSHQKYSLGLILQLSGFTWFIVTLGFYYKECLLLISRSGFLKNNTFTLYLNNTVTSKEKLLVYVLQIEHFLPFLSVAYISLLVFLSAKWVREYNYTQVIKRQGLHKIGVEWKAFVQHISYQLGIKSKVEIYLSTLVKTPLTIGSLKPLILIPVASINNLTQEQLEAVIIHELAHIKRYDYFYNLLLAFIEVTLFFNPFMLLISRHLKRERENCCDDWVLQYEYSPANYARALLTIATNHSLVTPAMAMKATDEKFALLNRIKRIIEKKEINFFNYRQQLMALFVITFVFSLLALISSKKDDRSTSINHKSLSLQPFAAKVHNPLFNPVFFLANNTETIEIRDIADTVNKILVDVSIANDEPPAPPHPPKTPIVTREPAALEIPAWADVDVKKTDNTVSLINKHSFNILKRFRSPEEIDELNLKTPSITENGNSTTWITTKGTEKFVLITRPTPAANKKAPIAGRKELLNEIRVSLNKLDGIKDKLTAMSGQVKNNTEKEWKVALGELRQAKEVFKQQKNEIILLDETLDLTGDLEDKTWIVSQIDEPEIIFTNTVKITQQFKKHNFSFDYKEKAERKAVNYIRILHNKKVKIKKECSALPKEEFMEMPEVAPLPPTPEAPVKIRTTKKLLVIKI